MGGKWNWKTTGALLAVFALAGISEYRAETVLNQTARDFDRVFDFSRAISNFNIDQYGFDQPNIYQVWRLRRVLGAEAAKAGFSHCTIGSDKKEWPEEAFGPTAEAHPGDRFVGVDIVDTGPGRKIMPGAGAYFEAPNAKVIAAMTFSTNCPANPSLQPGTKSSLDR